MISVGTEKLKNMRIKHLASLLAFFLIASIADAQDTLKVMHYNVLNYGNTTSYCTQQNNDIVQKAAGVNTIIQYVLPDIITVNEMGNNSFAPNHFLNSALNTNGITGYAASTITNLSGDNIGNMLYYNSSKMVLKEQITVPTTVRDFNIYRLYLLTSGLQNGDTSWINVATCHLKAGSSSSDKATRAAMTSTFMTHLDQNGMSGAWILSGDFNIRSSSETSYQNLIDHSNANLNFNDPINESGTWNSNSSFSAIHTQSTHYSSNGCASGGGMDDRFDFIMINNDIKNHTGDFSYVLGSYQAVGNDGNHFDDAINYQGNTSVPANVLQALYDVSDHLPVVCEIAFDKTIDAVEDISSLVPELEYVSLNQNSISMKFNRNIELSKVEIFDISGSSLISKSLKDRSERFSIQYNTSLSAGIYLCRMTDSEGNVYNYKTIKY